MKILLVGPAHSGKSTIANFLAADGKSSTIGSPDTKYEPTVGVRILEFDQGGSSESKTSRTISIELWDCSGRQEFEKCWPAIQDKADGVILVYNPDNRAHGAQLELWYEYFVKKAGLKASQVLVFAHRKMTQIGSSNIDRSVPQSIRRAVDSIYETDWDSTKRIREEFSAFASALDE
eukprot:g4390.t1